MLDNEFKKSATKKVTTMSANEYKEAFKAIGSKPQTNEEWLRNLSFNELARVLYCMIINGERIRPDLGYIKRWLKEIHE